MINNVEKILEARGDLSEKVRVADLEKEIFDIELDLLNLLNLLGLGLLGLLGLLGFIIVILLFQ